MAPARTRKQETSTSSNEDIPIFTDSPATVPTTTIASAQTPERDPTRKMAGITQVQKQALIDNLQLEITERARKLRAQYALQAQGLRTRLEMRVNRIPQVLRKRNIQDLVDEHTIKVKPAPPPALPVVNKSQMVQTTQPDPTKGKRTMKRKSDEISTGDDKENVPAQGSQDIANPKKRSKTAGPVATSKATRTTSRKAGPAGVLSPKSHNSRTLPQSPLKPSYLSPEKSQPTRPLTSTQSAAATRATTKATARAPSRQTKRTGPASDTEGRASEASNSSAGTTIITKPGTRRVPTAQKKSVPAKSTAAVKKSVAAPPARAGRTLRKRN